MIKITPRFFVLPLIAVSVIVALARQAPAPCRLDVARPDVTQDVLHARTAVTAVSCTARRQHLVMSQPAALLR